MKKDSDADRLIDMLLREELGRRVPPDLAEEILRKTLGDNGSRVESRSAKTSARDVKRVARRRSLSFSWGFWRLVS